ncbi:MAG: hypothetical protein HY696_02320 [Deltaproteobacteria bacterium]|nr:hypothetical protein [Deltaproteobacteria bacterium]
MAVRVGLPRLRRAIHELISLPGGLRPAYAMAGGSLGPQDRRAPRPVRGDPLRMTRVDEPTALRGDVAGESLDTVSAAGGIGITPPAVVPADARHLASTGHHAALLTGQLSALAAAAPQDRAAGAARIHATWWPATRVEHDAPQLLALFEVLETAAFTATGADRAAAVTLLAAVLTDTRVAINTPWGNVPLAIYGSSRLLAPSDAIPTEHRPQRLLRDALETLPGHFDTQFDAAAHYVWQAERDRFPALVGLARAFQCQDLLDRVGTMSELDAWLQTARGQRDDEVLQLLARPELLTRRQLAHTIAMAQDAYAAATIPALHRIRRHDTRRGIQRAAERALEAIGRHHAAAARQALAPLLLETTGRRARSLRRQLQRQLQQLAVLQARARLVASLPTTGQPALPTSDLYRGELVATPLSDTIQQLVAPYGRLQVERSHRDRVHMHCNRWWRIDLADAADVARIPAWIEAIGALAYPDAHRPVSLGLDGIAFTTDPAGVTPALREQLTRLMECSGLPPLLLLDRNDRSAPTIFEAHATYPPPVRLQHDLPAAEHAAATLGTALHAELRALAIELPRPLDVTIDLAIEGEPVPRMLEAIWAVVAPIAHDRGHLQAGVQRQVRREMLHSPMAHWALGGIALGGLQLLAQSYVAFPWWLASTGHLWVLGGMLAGVIRASRPSAIDAEIAAARFPERIRLQCGGVLLLEIVRDVGPYGFFAACAIRINRDHPLGPALHTAWTAGSKVPADLVALPASPTAA